MPSESEIRAQYKSLGLRIKRRNLLAAALCGAVSVYLSLRYFPHSFAGILIGFIVGCLYANAFEYFLHRFLLHSGRGIFAHQHMVHHETLHLPEGPCYVNFSRNPLGVVALFIANCAPFFVLQSWFHNGWTAGVFAAFALYYMAFEEIHWRSHMGGWLPRWVRPAARHHLLHHAQDDGRFNVFFPLFDWLVGSPAPQTEMPQSTTRR